MYSWVARSQGLNNHEDAGIWCSWYWAPSGDKPRGSGAVASWSGFAGLVVPFPQRDAE